MRSALSSKLKIKTFVIPALLSFALFPGPALSFSEAVPAPPGGTTDDEPPAASAQAQGPEPFPSAPVFTPPYRPSRAEARMEPGVAALNFSEAGLKDLIRAVSEATGLNFIVAPGVAARITVYTARPVPKKDVFGIFESILEANGLAAVRAGDYYKIMPAQNARQRAARVVEGKSPEEVPEGDGMATLIVPVEFVSANELLQALKPMLSPSGNIALYQKANALIITDASSNLKGLLDVVDSLDTDAFARMKFSLVPVRNADARTLNRELSEVFAALGLGKETPQVAVVPVERLNSLIVFSSTEELLRSVLEWIGRLDGASGGEGTALHTYHVLNDKASNLKNLLEQVYSGRKNPTPSAMAAAGAQQSQPKAETRGEGANGEVKIHLYEPANALIIQSTGIDYQNILSTIRELDKPPKQVLIDALIAEVRLDESTRFGIQWSVLQGNLNIQQNTGIFSTSINNPRGDLSTPAGAPAPSGLSVFATDSSRFFAVIQALASTGKVNVLSNPHIVVKNYEKASINVGSDEPVATQSTQTAVTGTSGLIQNIEYRKTGVILTVTPQITEGGMVAMNIRQEVSDKSTDRTVGSAVYPSFTKREAETSVVAKDKETLVIGGLIQERDDGSSNGIPVLSSIPFIGSLFKFTSANRSKTELVILLTPTVISGPEDGRKATEAFKERLKGLKRILKAKEGAKDR